MILGIIPARWGSTRFPGKPLYPLLGKPLIEHVWNRASACNTLDKLLVATDDKRIFQAVENFGGHAVMTSESHESGTDRLAEVCQTIPEATIAVNIQGDEPLVEAPLIDRLATALTEDPTLSMATVASPFDKTADKTDPNLVKVVFNRAGNALYFSRSAIPFARSNPPGLQWYRHHGIYAYRADFLQNYVAWPPSVLEKSEGLEQLRALDYGAQIRVLLSESESIGLDTPDQVSMIEALLAADL